MNRRRLLLGAAGASAAALSNPWSIAGAATDDDLAFANFGVSAEFLLEAYYARALARKQFAGARANVLRKGHTAAIRHATALGTMLTDAADAPPVEEDFEFVWPARAFRTPAATVRTGLTLLRALLGAYQTAAAQASTPDYRTLFASLGASLGEQIGALSALSAPAGAEPFPVAMDVESASRILEPYLG
jgi:ferritin-like protein